MKDRIVNLIIKLLASHRTVIREECVKDIFLDKTDIIKHIHSGNHVIQTKQGFFRFCPLHAPLQDFYRQRINYHLKAIPFNQFDFDFLNTYLSTSDNLLDFVKFCVSRRYTDDIYKGFSQKSHILGIMSYKSANEDEFNRNLYDLAYCISADVSQYKKNKFINRPETFSANRIMAQEALAKLLGIENIFPHTDFVNLHINNQIPAFGIMMDASRGIYPLKLRNKLSQSITPNLQRELVVLNFHDVICNEKDHRPGNYHILMDETNTKATHISVFDNDCRWTFFPTKSVTFKTYAGASPLLNANGEINRPYLDKDFADRLIKITKDDLYGSLNPYLNKLQISACYAKIVKLKKAIVKTSKNHKVFLIEQDKWNDTTIREELSGKFGNTYLHIYYHWYERMLREHPEIFNSFNINMTD